MACRNRIKYWRLQLAAKRGYEIDQREMARMLEVDYGQYNKWETTGRPPNGTNLWKIWTVLRRDFPKMNMQDLLEDTD